MVSRELASASSSLNVKNVIFAGRDRLPAGESFSAYM
jgi:hypothetical protein